MTSACWILALCLAGDLVDDDRQGVELKTDLAKDQRDRVYATVVDTSERVTALLQSLALKRKQTRMLRLRVYASEAEFEKRKRRTFDARRQWARGFIDLACNEVVVSWQDDGVGPRSLRHELTHFVLAEYAVDPPAWLDEGLAEYFAAQEVDEHGDLITTVDPQHLRRVRIAIANGGLCPVPTFLQLKATDFYGDADSMQATWDHWTSYAQAWSLVYFLLEEAHDRPMLDLVAQRLERGVWGPELAGRLPAFQTRWQAFIGSGDLEEPDLLTKEARDALVARNLPRALGFARSALEVKPRRRAARRVLAEASLIAGDDEQAYRACNYLLAEKEADPAAHLCRARALIGLYRREQQPYLASRAAASALRAAELSPPRERPECLLVAVTAFESAGDIKAALATCRDALHVEDLARTMKLVLEQRETELSRQLTR